MDEISSIEMHNNTNLTNSKRDNKVSQNAEFVKGNARFHADLKELAKQDSILSELSHKELSSLLAHKDMLLQISHLSSASVCFSLTDGRVYSTNEVFLESLDSKKEIFCNIENKPTINLAQHIYTKLTGDIGLQSIVQSDCMCANKSLFSLIKTGLIEQSKEGLHLFFVSRSLNDRNNSKNVAKGDNARVIDTSLESIKDLAFQLKPWRKGPFYLHFLYSHTESDGQLKVNSNGLTFCIDAEWRSNVKMKLVMQALQNLQYDVRGKEILDVGCNNGYYMFDLIMRGARHVVGIDPIPIFFMQFYYIAKLGGVSNCSFRLLGVQDINLLERKFDLVLCMGVLYHRKEPLQTLRQLRMAMKSESLLILETLIIQSDMPICLCPYPTYAKMSNVFYIFSPKALYNLAMQAGFKTCKMLSFSYTNSQEQRSTDFIERQSLGDFLASDNTSEGYPPACRGIFALRI